ncbi:amino acid permease C-terminal domain-containing protein [Arthrobacter sp. UCD-GKA]|uniref:amino acid permease C-terminal domain-containing protein n=1 Tax=Arthrobacter sp. UCD-GKA TaxID=1913576 RepID=UPI0009F1A0E7|nr:amino acid permease C-terminal domain-containing protein [Arthrobacter sp. UCD-GKA]
MARQECSPRFLMLQLHWETWLRFAIWLLVDLAIYFTYGRKHSLMNPDSPPAQRARGAAARGNVGVN